MKGVTVKRGRCRLCNVRTTYDFDKVEDVSDNAEAIKNKERSRRIQYRGFRFICKRLHAELPPYSLWKANQIFCSVCDKFLTTIHQILLNIEVCQMKLEAKIDDVKERAISVEEEELRRTVKEKEDSNSKGRVVTIASLASASGFCNQFAFLARRPPNPTVRLVRVSLPPVTTRVLALPSQDAHHGKTSTPNRDHNISSSPGFIPQRVELKQVSPTDEDVFFMSPDSPVSNISIADAEDFTAPDDLNQSEDVETCRAYSKRRSSRLKYRGSGCSKLPLNPVIKLTKKNSGKDKKLHSLTGSRGMGNNNLTCEYGSDSESSENSSESSDSSEEDNHNGMLSDRDPLYIPDDDEIEKECSYDSNCEDNSIFSEGDKVGNKRSHFRLNSDAKLISPFNAQLSKCQSTISFHPPSNLVTTVVTSKTNGSEIQTAFPVPVAFSLQPQSSLATIGPSPCNTVLASINGTDSEGRIAIPQKIYRCDYCEAFFIDKRLVVRHYDQLHPEKPKFPCSKCERKFYLSSDLELHLDRDHLSASVNGFCGTNLGIIPIFPESKSADPKKIVKKRSKADMQPVDKIDIHLKGKGKRRSFVKIECPLCSEKLNSLPKLTYHLLTFHETDDKPENCGMCSEKFTQKINLENHIKKHHKNIKLSCDFCIKKFSSQLKLDKHLSTKHKRIQKSKTSTDVYQVSKPKKKSRACYRKYKLNSRIESVCHICGDKFKSRHNFKDHLRWHSPEGNPFKCEECGKSWRGRGGLRQHIYSIHMNKPYKRKRIRASGKNWMCETCGKVFSGENNLKFHIKRFHDEALAGVTVQCPECLKTVPKIYFRRHTQNHKIIKVKNPCDICGKLLSKAGIIKHKKNNNCHFRLASNSSAASSLHSITASGSGTKTSIIDNNSMSNNIGGRSRDGDITTIPEDAIKSNPTCSQSFQRETDTDQTAVTTRIPQIVILSSKAIQKKKKKRTEQGLCKEIFRHKLNMKMPCSEEDYACRICGENYARDQLMKDHFREAHKGSKPFKCTYHPCELSTWTRNDVRKHIYHKHMTEEEKKPFQTRQCNYCERKFAYFSSGALRQHIKIHTNERPFACTCCNIGFRAAPELRKHKLSDRHKQREYMMEKIVARVEMENDLSSLTSLPSQD